MMKRRLTAFLVTLAVIILALTSCADMGAGESVDDCRDYFSSVVLLDREGRHDDDIATFLNFEDEDSDLTVHEVIKESDYCYVALQVREGYTLTISEMAMFLRSDERSGFAIELYRSDKIPTKLGNGDGTYTYLPDENGDMPSKDKDGNYVDRKDEVDESVLNSTNLIKRDALRASSDWDSTHVDFSRTTITGGEYLVIKFVDNCAGGEKLANTYRFTLNYIMFYFESVEN